MSKTIVAGILGAGITIACVVFFVVLLLLKGLWAWTIPDLLPGATQQGLVAGSISWLTAAKVAIFITVLSRISGRKVYYETRWITPPAE